MDALPTRDWKQAVLLGLRGRCPACGGASLFAQWLKPVATCPACGQDWRHHRADDFPAYLVILIVGHVMVPVMIEANMAFDLPTGWQMLLWPVLAAMLAMAMLRPVKGAVIGAQWVLRMGGFGP